MKSNFKTVLIKMPMLLSYTYEHIPYFSIICNLQTKVVTLVFSQNPSRTGISGFTGSLTNGSTGILGEDITSSS